MITHSNDIVSVPFISFSFYFPDREINVSLKWREGWTQMHMIAYRRLTRPSQRHTCPVPLTERRHPATSQSSQHQLRAVDGNALKLMRGAWLRMVRAVLLNPVLRLRLQKQLLLLPRHCWRCCRYHHTLQWFLVEVSPSLEAVPLVRWQTLHGFQMYGTTAHP